MNADHLNIQWYPGHMTKTRRQIEADLKLVDAVCEIVDARIPMSSRNPDIDSICGNKPRIIVLNRMDLADPNATKQWAAYFRAKGYAVLESDAKDGMGTTKFAGAVRELLADKLRAYAEKGMVGRVVRVMILGIPNVGKSTFINKVAGRKTAKTEDRPGVTRSKQWVPIDRGLELLDTPGILWPKFEDQSVGLNLAYTGAVKDDILDVVSTAEVLGKPVLSDEKNEKTTYVTLEGLEKAKADVKMISDRACDTLQGLPGEKEFLSQLIEMLVHREN